MTTEPGSREEVAALRRRLEAAAARDALRDASDEALERATIERQPLGRALGHLMRLVVEHTGASMAFVTTFDESSAVREFVWPVGTKWPFSDLIYDGDLGRESVYHQDGWTILGQPLDVAGECYGKAALSFESEPAESRLEEARSLLGVWCEEIDNYLAAIALARKKHQVTGELSEALKDPLLDRGIRRAIEVLQDNVELDDLLLAYRHEDEIDGRTLGYKIVQDTNLVHDSSVEPRGSDVDTFMRSHAPWVPDGKDADVPGYFGITKYREDVLISGVKDQTLVGRLIVTTRRGEFTTFDRDLIERFVDYLRQRIVDFNREWKYLSRCFSQPVVARLLAEEDYVSRFLAPREKDVAIVYCDISGFTRLSERVLKEPALIGKLIDTWSERVVDIIWQTGGVFDKMVGDCVIGLWGPPFFEWSPQETCTRALDAAIRIRDHSRNLGHDPAWPQLKSLEPPIGVSTGLNYASLFVGLFGPDDAFTGFSSGMNNAARLQGVALRDEILCMDGLAETVGEPERFGALREAVVKNVSHPLRFRPLLSS